MRSRRPEGSGGVRLPSPPPSNVRDHHRSNWHGNRYREERFSPSLERERLSRQALNSGERRSTPVARRPFPGYLDSAGDNSSGQIHIRPLDDSFPYREVLASEYRRGYFDVDIEANPSAKHVGVSSMGGGSSGGNFKLTKDKDFLPYGSSDFDAILKTSTCSDDGTVRTFMLPPGSGYLSSGFNFSKIGGSSTYPPTSSPSFGGNLNTGASEDILYQNRLASGKVPSREPYEEEDKQRTLYSRNVSYPALAPSSVASQSKAFGATSSSLTRDRLLGSYRDTLNLKSVSGFGGSNGGKFMDPLDGNPHGVGQKLFDHPTSFSEIESKDMEAYQRRMISPSGDEPYDYSFLELDRRGRDSSFLSDESYKKSHLNVQRDYSFRDPLGSTFTGHIVDRIDDTDSSCRIVRATGGIFWDDQKDSLTKFHDSDGGLALAMDRHRELFNSGDIHPDFVTELNRDHDIMHSGGDDYGFERDVSSMSYRERLNSPPLSDRDPDFYRLDMDTERRLNVEGLEVYDHDHSDMTAKRKYAIDEINEYDLRSSLASTQHTSRHLWNRLGKNEHAKWNAEDRVRFFPSRRFGLGHAPYKFPGKSFTSSRKVTITDAWLSRENMPLHMRAVGGKDVSLKRRLRPGTSEFQNSLQFEKRNNFNKPRKFPKRSMDGSDVGAKVHGEDAEDDPTPPVKIDPPEGSEEFKQQVHRAFLRFSKQLNENPAQKRRYREQGNAGSLLCSACGSLSREFVDTHSLVTHAFNSLKVGLRTDHLGLHKALCVMMGWNSLIPPDNVKAYQSMPVAEASALKEDLILWPPLIVTHNSSIGKKNTSDRVVVTNERMEEILREMGFGAGTKDCQVKPANHSILVVKFLPTFSGLQMAERLHRYYVENKRGRKEFEQIDSDNIKDDSREGESMGKSEQLLLYGYMGIAEDLDKLDFEMKKRCLIRSKKEIDAIADATLKTD